MLNTLRTLFTAASARAEEQVRDVFALDLIDQKIRETEAQLKAAKATLATLVQRQRSEVRMHDALTGRIETMTHRAQKALDDNNTDMANRAAEAIAMMENETHLRQDTIDRLETQASRLRDSVGAAHRRIIDLKQGAITARAIRREQQMQKRLNSTIDSTSSADEAEDLIAKVIGRDDPFEQSRILAEINADLSHDKLDERMAAQGYGPATKVTANDVLARLEKD